jgi:hypothetical protein
MRISAVHALVASLMMSAMPALADEAKAPAAPPATTQAAPAPPATAPAPTTQAQPEKAPTPATPDPKKDVAPTPPKTDTPPDKKAEEGKKPVKALANALAARKALLDKYLGSYEKNYDAVVAAREAWKTFVDSQWKAAKGEEQKKLRPQMLKLRADLWRAEIHWQEWHMSWLNYHLGMAKSFANALPIWTKNVAAYKATIERLRDQLKANK